MRPAPRRWVEACSASRISCRKAKRVIYLVMSGAPSQLETFDYKPKLKELHNKDLPDSVRKGQRLTTMTSGQGRMRHRRTAVRASSSTDAQGVVGQRAASSTSAASSTTSASSVPCTPRPSTTTPRSPFMMTGSRRQPGRPSIGAWLSYGLGSDNDNLPAFVVMRHLAGEEVRSGPFLPPLGHRLPAFASTRAVHCGGKGDPVLYLNGPRRRRPPARRRLMLDRLTRLNQPLSGIGDPETNARIAQYEMAYRMQMSMPEAGGSLAASRSRCSISTAPTSRSPAPTPPTA
jgi:hypothetical protein